MAQEFTSGRFKSWLDSGLPNAGGRLYTYVSGTTTFKAAYTDATLSTPCTYTADGFGGQYMSLDARGEAQVWLGSGAYTIAAKTSLGVTIDSTDGVTDPANTAAAALAAYQATLSSSSGAANIGVTQTAAHAVVSTAQAELRRTYAVAQWGAVGDDSTDDTTAILNAINEVPAGATLVLKGTSGEIFRTSGITATRSNITIRGSAKPKSNSGHTALEGGTIIRGTFVIDGDNIALEKFGVDAGITYTNTYKAGVGSNGLVVHSLTLSTIRRGITVRDMIGMARVGAFTDPQAAFHSVLLEGLENGCSDNVTGVGGLYGVVLKVANWTFNGLTGIENDTAGVYIKSNSYAPVANVVGVNTVTIAGGSRAFYGLIVSASDAQLNQVAVSGVTMIGGGGGGAVCITSETTQPNVGTTVTDITTTGTVLGVVVSGPVYTCRVHGTVDKPSNGCSLQIQANASSIQPIDVTADIRSNVDTALSASNQCSITATTTRVWLARFYATVNYAPLVGGTLGLIQVTANTQVGDVYGTVSCDTTESNLTNSWAVFSAGQHCGTQTRNGRTVGYGRIKFSSATSDSFLTLPSGAFPAGTSFLVSATGYTGATGLPAPVYIAVSAAGVCSISPNRAAYSGVSYLDLTSLNIPAQLPINTGF